MGRRPRRASRPASPALDECRWTTSGATESRIRRSRRTSPNTRGPGPPSEPMDVLRAQPLDLVVQPAVARARDGDLPAAGDLVGHEVSDSVRRRPRRVAHGGRQFSRDACSIVRGVIDLHSHILPGLDDGTRSLEEARELARQAASDGITAIAATPHVRPDYPTTPEEMEWGVDELRADFQARTSRRFSTEPRSISASSGRSRARSSAGRSQRGRYSSSSRTAAGRCAQRTVSASSTGITPVLAHPERNPEVQDRLARIQELVELGALLQITADRLRRARPSRAVRRRTAHRAGRGAHARQRLAWTAHRAGGMPAAVEALGDDELARYPTVDVPTAVVGGSVPAPHQVRLSAPEPDAPTRSRRRGSRPGRRPASSIMAAILSIEGARWNISSSMPRSKTSS